MARTIKKDREEPVLPSMHSKTPKHVIFLGAGASFTSGYPLADGLRKHWLSANDGLAIKVNEALETTNADAQNKNKCRSDLQQWLQGIGQSLNLFRQGGFGTIDEFCYLVRNAQPKQVQDLKRVLRLVLGLNSPETKFTQSDYYSFIQTLFVPDRLHALRDDIIVLSFNYDPYLEWLLRRAVSIRREALGSTGDRALWNDAPALAAITSGFSGGDRTIKTLVDGDGFCLLKLHGTIAWPDHGAMHERSRHCAFSDLFNGNDIAARIQTLCSIEAGNSVVPIVFPWEVFDEDGMFIKKENFHNKDEPIRAGDVHLMHGRNPGSPNLHEIFEAIWTRARAEVQAAAKISFVGISMNDYLNPAFEFLFKGKGGAVTVAATDYEQTAINRGQGGQDPRSTPGKIHRMFDSYYPPWSGRIPDGLRVVKDFEGFIRREMDPLSDAEMARQRPGWKRPTKLVVA